MKIFIFVMTLSDNRLSGRVNRLSGCVNKPSGRVNKPSGCPEHVMMKVADHDGLSSPGLFKTERPDGRSSPDRPGI